MKIPTEGPFRYAGTHMWSAYKKNTQTVNIWNYLSKHIPVNVTYIRFNKLTKSYLLNNNIIYRLV